MDTTGTTTIDTTGTTTIDDSGTPVDGPGTTIDGIGTPVDGTGTTVDGSGESGLTEDNNSVTVSTTLEDRDTRSTTISSEETEPTAIISEVLPNLPECCEETPIPPSGATTSLLLSKLKKPQKENSSIADDDGSTEEIPIVEYVNLSFPKNDEIPEEKIENKVLIPLENITWNFSNPEITPPSVNTFNGKPVSVESVVVENGNPDRTEVSVVSETSSSGQQKNLTKEQVNKFVIVAQDSKEEVSSNSQNDKETVVAQPSLWNKVVPNSQQVNVALDSQSNPEVEVSQNSQKEQEGKLQSGKVEIESNVAPEPKPTKPSQVSLWGHFSNVSPEPQGFSSKQPLTVSLEKPSTVAHRPMWYQPPTAIPIPGSPWNHASNVAPDSQRYKPHTSSWSQPSKVSPESLKIPSTHQGSTWSQPSKVSPESLKIPSTHHGSTWNQPSKVSPESHWISSTSHISSWNQPSKVSLESSLKPGSDSQRFKPSTLPPAPSWNHALPPKYSQSTESLDSKVTPTPESEESISQNQDSGENKVSSPEGWLLPPFESGWVRFPELFENADRKGSVDKSRPGPDFTLFSEQRGNSKFRFPEEYEDEDEKRPPPILKFWSQVPMYKGQESAEHRIYQSEEDHWIAP